jgi:hypothetical protein
MYFTEYNGDTWDVYSHEGAFWYGSYGTEQRANERMNSLEEADTERLNDENPNLRY